MNKQTQTPKKNTGIYIKFAIIMVLSALAGGVGSILMFDYEDALLGLFRRISDGLILAGPWLLAAGLVPCAVATVLYCFGKKAAARADEDDAAFETASRRLSLSITAATVVIPWMMLTVCLALPAVNKMANNVFVVAVAPLLVVELAWSYGLQAAAMRVTQRLAPEKRGNLFDLRFQKDWYASCDEAERQRIGECSYRTYIVMTSIYPFVMVAVLLAATYGGASVLWAVLLGGLWLTQTLVYLVHAFRLDHGRPKAE